MARASKLIAATFVTLCALVLGTPEMAAAHPWGEPPKAVVRADGDTVLVEWRAEDDDTVALGVELGLLDPVLLDWDWDGPKPSSEGEPLLPLSEPLRRHLLDNIRVFQDGVLCKGRIVPFDDFLTKGVTTVHTCASSVKAVDLEITMLHEVNQAYRTFAEGRGPTQPRRTAFTSGTPRQTWTFGVSPEDDKAWVQTAAGTAVAAMLSGMALHRRRRRRRQDSRPDLEAARPPAALTGTRFHAVAPYAVVAAAAERWRFGWLEAELLSLVEAADLVLGLVAITVAFGVGAAHALAPGHGKALMGAYLVGSRGRMRDAAVLGAVVAGMHCASVLVLGGVFTTTMSSGSEVGEILPWMRLSAGLLVVVVGAGMALRHAGLRPRFAHRLAAVSHRDGGDTRNHVHEHHGDHHHELPRGVRPLSRRGLVAMGASGGLLPSPAALLVLTTAAVMGRAAFGLALVAAFSLGLAATLTVFGFAAVKGHTLARRLAVTTPALASATRSLPLVSSVAVLSGGLWLTALALGRL